MFINNRVIHKDATVFTDISALLSDPYMGEQALAVVAADDALYLGSDLPFNHRFLMLGKKNTISGTVSVAIWTGSAFTAAEDVQDFTALGGVPFARNGLLRWTLPKNVGWASVYDSSDIEELEDLKSKANFWVKITFSAAFDFELKYVGFRFARDADLRTYYRDLLTERVMQAVNGGVPMKDWDAFHVVAAEEIIRDLRAQQIVFSGNQILNPETFQDAACHKLAEMAYSNLSNEDRLEFAQGKYRQAMSKMVFDVDKDGDGRLESIEKQDAYAGRLLRT